MFPEWLAKEFASVPNELDWRALTFRLVISALCGLIVSGVYAVSQRRPMSQALPLFTTLVLLTILVAMSTFVIGDNAARAFGLVGALSIVRFRTVVEDTRDTSFVIFAVVVGMALGAGHYRVCLIGLPIAATVAIGLSAYGGLLHRPPTTRRLEIRIGAGHEPEQLLADVFRDQLSYFKLTSVISARQGAALDLLYQVKLREPRGLLALVKAIHALEGVQSVELKDVSFS